MRKFQEVTHNHPVSRLHGDPYFSLPAFCMSRSSTGATPGSGHTAGKLVSGLSSWLYFAMVIVDRFHASLDEGSSPLALQLRDFVLLLAGSPAAEATALVECAEVVGQVEGVEHAAEVFAVDALGDAVQLCRGVEPLPVAGA